MLDCWSAVADIEAINSGVSRAIFVRGITLLTRVSWRFYTKILPGGHDLRGANLHPRGFQGEISGTRIPGVENTRGVLVVPTTTGIGRPSSTRECPRLIGKLVPPLVKEYPVWPCVVYESSTEIYPFLLLLSLWRSIDICMILWLVIIGGLRIAWSYHVPGT